jgi:C-terminal processing protease CtpA/Prc
VYESLNSLNKSGIELAHNGVRVVKQVERSLKTPRANTQAKNNTIILDPKYKLSLQPAFAIVELRQGSPAELAGLRVGDVVLTINGKQTYELSLQEIMQVFYDYHGKRIKMKIDRNGAVQIYNFQLQKLF